MAMSLSSLLALAGGLAMDAAAVSAARGLAVPVLRARHFALVAVFFGGFQALMPLLGWFLGRQLGPLVVAWDHWIAFGLLGGIGAKMLWEARSGGDEAQMDQDDPFGIRVMLVLAIATSIDAFAVGVMLPMLDAPLGLSLATIGVVTALLSMAGLLAGRRFGALLGRRLDSVGGLALIALGFKILVEHLSGS
jgi:putative Mn2+ efflux pump MntP